MQRAFDISRMGYRQSSRDCLISWEGNFYSVPAAYILEKLQIKETPQKELLIFSSQGEQIACHSLSDGRGQRVIQAEHYSGIKPIRQINQRAGAVQIKAPSTPLMGIAEAPLVEARPLSVYDEVLEGVA
jgi:hypothetical protein